MVHEYRQWRIFLGKFLCVTLHMADGLRNFGTAGADVAAPECLLFKTWSSLPFNL